LDASGLIQFYMDATVTIPTPPGRTGPFSLQVPVPIGLLGQDEAIVRLTVDPLIAAAVASLQKSAGVTQAAAPTAAASSG
jgi:hypothetical protein